MTVTVKTLKPEEVRLTVAPSDLKVTSFEELLETLETEKPIMAQERAIRALDFGLNFEDLDFHMYVAGTPELGTSYITRALVESQARERPTPSDWCYVYNFKDPDVPKALELPPGKGREFQKDMADLIETLRQKIPEAFESEAYITKKEQIIREFNVTRAKIFEELEQKVKAEGFILNVEPFGMMIIPAKPDGTPMTPEDVKELPEEVKENLKRKSEFLQKELNATARRIQQLEKDLRQKLKELDREVALNVVGSFIQELREKYATTKGVVSFLNEVQEDIIKHLDDFRQKPAPQPPMPFPMPPAQPSFTHYEVNVFVDNSECQGAPVIFEPNPTYTNLFGTIERKAQFGALITDFTMLKAGSLHKANGGFLIVRALDLLKYPFSWENLKRAIKTRKIYLEDLAEQIGLFTTKTLKPEPIPFRAKVVLQGDPFIYHLLYIYDENFREVFKVKAHLDRWVDRTEETTRQFLQAVAAMVKHNQLLPLENDALAKIVEYSCELAGRQDKLSLELPVIQDVLKEAHFWAKREQKEAINAFHIEKAINERKFRANLSEERLQEMIEKDIIKIQVDGELCGSINGLSVYDLGDYSFGRPTRITANISLGKEGVVNIEREADLSGKIHTKGVLILAGFLRERFVHDKPLTLTATLCFEQSYGLVDGDSASSAELFALISALSGVPIYQGIAVTGSVSQKGDIQPVGGINQKIEGFYKVCKAKGLNGKQGVIIPQANVKELMLDKEVVKAIEEGQFHIWAISRVEEGIEILTGKPAGERKPDGTYPEGTIFYLVDQKLRELAKLARDFAKEEKK
ncbi:Lon protease family protein [Thermodesulfatator indicus]